MSDDDEYDDPLDPGTFRLDERDYLRELTEEVNGLRHQVKELSDVIQCMRVERYEHRTPVQIGNQFELMAYVVIITCVVYWFQ